MRNVERQKKKKKTNSKRNKIKTYQHNVQNTIFILPSLDRRLDYISLEYRGLVRDQFPLMPRRLLTTSRLANNPGT